MTSAWLPRARAPVTCGPAGSCTICNLSRINLCRTTIACHSCISIQTHLLSCRCMSRLSQPFVYACKTISRIEHKMNRTLYDRALDEMSSRLPILSSSLIVLLAAVLAQAFFKADTLAHIPIVGKGGKEARRKQYVSGGAWELYEEGYRRASFESSSHTVLSHS